MKRSFAFSQTQSFQFYGVYSQEAHQADSDSIPNLDRSSFTGDSESKDSHTEPKEWFYDDDVMHDVVDPFEDRGDSDFDFGKLFTVFFFHHRLMA